MKAGDFNAIIPPLDSVRMKDFLDRVLQLPYKSNSQDNPEHEEQVKDLLDEFGIFYEYQPNGSQKFPDFRCETKWGTLNIECKSSKGHQPVYNGGLPKEGALYIFSSQKYNATTFFFGHDVCYHDTTVWMNDTISKLQETLDECRKVKPEDDRGFDFYIRNMFIQQGGGEKCDYFTHTNRELCESNVYNHFG